MKLRTRIGTDVSAPAMKRRDFLAGAGGALATSLMMSSAVSDAQKKPASSAVRAPDEAQWRKLDATIRTWWDGDVRQATEAEIRQAAQPGALFLPFPYVAPSGAGDTYFPFMFAWDTYFYNRSLLAHGRSELVRNHIRNYLFMIERRGFMPNANHTALATRSQTPVFPDSVWRYYVASGDLDLLYQAYPLLKSEYRDYWNGSHHQTPIGLATNRDLGDPTLPPSLAAEAETGLDWTPIYDGDVRRCVPLITNCALVRYARVLALIGKEVGRVREAAQFSEEAAARTRLIHKYCWNEQAGLFVEYDYVAAKQLPYMSDCTYWPLWAGIATSSQARRLVDNLHRLEQPHGLSCTDQAYPNPLPNEDYGMTEGTMAPDGKAVVATDVPPEGVGGRDWLQWMYPAGWAPMHIIAVQGLEAYGYAEAAERIASRYLAVLLDQYAKTGRLWEKYNVVDGGLFLPNSRYGNVPMHGWTAAAAVLLGRRLFLNESLQAKEA